MDLALEFLKLFAEELDKLKTLQLYTFDIDESSTTDKSEL